MGLIFHTAPPRRSGAEGLHPDPHAPAEARALALRAAVRSQLLGDIRPVLDLFTSDVVCTTPHAVLRSIDELLEACDAPEESLSDAVLLFRSFQSADDTACAEWELDATFSGPLLLEDDILIEPTRTRVRLTGATFAEFRHGRMSSVRHYFDDSELLAHVTGDARYRRWFASRPGDQDT